MAPDDTENTPQIPEKMNPAVLASQEQLAVPDGHSTSPNPEQVASVWKGLMAHSSSAENHQRADAQKENTDNLRQKTAPLVNTPILSVQPPMTAGGAQTEPNHPRLAPGMPGYTPQGAHPPLAQSGDGAFPQNRPSLLARIRTYKSDVAALMKGNKTSLADVALAGAKRQRDVEQKTPLAQMPVEKTKRNKHTLRFISIILLLLAGAATLLFLFFFMPRNKPAVVNTITVTPLIFADQQREIDLSRTGRQATLTALSQEVDKVALPLGSLAHLYLTEGAGLEKKLIPAERLFEILEARPPATLVRSLKPDFMFGSHVFDGNQPFLIFKTTFFENAFAGMLKWEDDLAFDLGPLFVYKKQNVPTATSTQTTATQTPAVAPHGAVALTERRFEDAVVENKDARVLRDGNGKITFLYTFADRDTLIMTTNEYTLKEILYRMTTLRFVP